MELLLIRAHLDAFRAGDLSRLDDANKEISDIMLDGQKSLYKSIVSRFDFVSLCFVLARADAISWLCSKVYGLNNVEIRFGADLPNHDLFFRWSHSTDGNPLFEFREAKWFFHLEIFVIRWLDLVDVYIYAVKKLPFTSRIIVSLDDLGGGFGLGFCDNENFVNLIPDCYFVGSKGYEANRVAYASQNHLWHERSDSVFWRGATTGLFSDNVEELPRVALCLLARQHATWDIGITSIDALSEGNTEHVSELGITKPYVQSINFSNYKYHIDIDGNSNSWPGLFQKLLSGGLVFKIESPHGYRQWYYNDLISDYNYVSIKSDFSDLAEKVTFYQHHQIEAERIARNGQNLANIMSYERELERVMLTVARHIASRSRN